MKPEIKPGDIIILDDKEYIFIGFKTTWVDSFEEYIPTVYIVDKNFIKEPFISIIGEASFWGKLKFINGVPYHHPINITKDDIGRKFKTRDGNIGVIIHVNPSTSKDVFRVKGAVIGEGYREYKVNGFWGIPDEESSFDIIELLEKVI